MEGAGGCDLGEGVLSAATVKQDLTTGGFWPWRQSPVYLNLWEHFCLNGPWTPACAFYSPAPSGKLSSLLRTGEPFSFCVQASFFLAGPSNQPRPAAPSSVFNSWPLLSHISYWINLRLFIFLFIKDSVYLADKVENVEK